MKLRKPQLRVLQALASGALLTRTKLCERIGFSPISGTLNYALNGMKMSKANPRPHPGLIEMGLVKRLDLEIEAGLVEICYQATEEGLNYLEGIDDLGELRDRDISTNHRYKEKP